MESIIVMGGGIGGVAAALELREALPAEQQVTLVSDNPNFEFTPSNPWVAVSWRKPEAIRVDLAPVMQKKGVEFVCDAVSRVEPDQKSLRLASGKRIPFDYLVIATGPRLAFDEIEGLGPEAYTVSVCKTEHAASAAENTESLFNDPGPVVIGAAQGASCFGPAYEYAFILETELRRRKIRDRVPITSLTPEPYIGHLGLDGVGDTKSLLESAMRERDIKWLTNTRIDRVEQGRMHVTTVNADGAVAKTTELKYRHAMILPAFTGIEAVQGVEGLVNPRGFVLIDEFQRNPTWPFIYAVGVCVAIPPVGESPLPVGVPKTGYMIESMVTATVKNIALAIEGSEPAHRATWNALCLADFGDRGVAFLALPQIPPRNTNWSSAGRWVHWAKVAFEKYFLRKVRKGSVEPFYEKLTMRLLGAAKLRRQV